MEMLRSREKELLDEIAKLKAERDAAYGAALRKCNRAILMCKDISVDTKDFLLSQIWDK